MRDTRYVTLDPLRLGLGVRHGDTAASLAKPNVAGLRPRLSQARPGSRPNASAIRRLVHPIPSAKRLSPNPPHRNHASARVTQPEVVFLPLICHYFRMGPRNLNVRLFLAPEASHHSCIASSRQARNAGSAIATSSEQKRGSEDRPRDRQAGPRPRARWRSRASAAA
jgi:hypothetical protein